MKFGDNLRKLRRQKRLSQEELAEKVGVSRQSVSKWETGEAYPEMNNILELCKIFQCKINDLVNDSVVDLDSLDEEIKITVVKFKKEQQKKMKGLSKAIIIMSRICRILLTVCVPIILLIMLAIPFLIYNIDIKDNELTFRGTDEKIEILSEKSDVTLKIDDREIDDQELGNLIIKYKEIIDTHSKPIFIGYIEIGFIFIFIILILYIRIIKHLEELFVNINKGDTPFTIVNINHIKKMAYLMIITIVLPYISEIVFTLALMMEIDISFEIFDVIEILFLLSMAYIFEYGYELQLDSSAKMYDSENK